MNAPAFYTCRSCGDEIPCEVEIGEESDLPANCPTCRHPIPDSAHGAMQEQAIERMADQAKDLYD